MWSMFLVICLACVCAFAGQAEQSDWSEGLSSETPVSSWLRVFESADQVAWRSIEGQIQLSSSILDTAVENFVYSGIAKPYAADIDDINNDGYNDIVIGALEANEVRVFFGNENGEWISQVLSSSSSECIGIDIADLNNDGYLDVVAACAGTGIIEIHYNQGGPSPEWILQVAATGFEGVHDVEADDVDEDGDMDIVAAASEGDRVSWFRNEGGQSPSWSEFIVETGIDYPCKVQPVDLNSDGNIDILCAAWNENIVRVWYGSGGPEPVWTSQTLDSDIEGAHGVRACDVDADGDMDVFAASLGGSKVYLYRNQGGSPITWTREELGTMPYSAMVRTGDFDGDGDWDVVSSSFGNAGVAWWENTENGSIFVKHIVKSGGQGISWAMPGDLDNDGDLDILSVRYMGNAIYWYEITRYASSGSLVSSILDSSEEPQWASIDWESCVPAGTSLGIQFRSSDDHGSMGNWSEEYHNPSVISGFAERYFQYKVLMNSVDSTVSPILKSFQFNWDQTGIEMTDSPLSLSFSNPSSGSVSMFVKSNISGDFTLSIFDTSGRKVFLDTGETEKQFEVAHLPSGVYRAVASTTQGDWISQALVVLN